MDEIYTSDVLDGDHQGVALEIPFGDIVRIDRYSARSAHVVMSDGEMNEGQTWEAAAMAAHHKLDHLIMILDYNKYQLDDSCKVICDMEPMVDKWKSFRWNVQEIDGHDFTQVIGALNKAKQVKDRPAMIVAHTIKGKGVSFMENNNEFHGVAPTPEEQAKALKELE